jgi:hypothetical protein
MLALPCFDLHAELSFSRVEQPGSAQRAAPIRKYSNPSDIAYPRVSANGARVSSDEVQVLISGQITDEDVDGLAVLASLLSSGRQRIAGNSVRLASTGGDIDAAMKLGRQLRELGLFTYVGKGDRCMSACVFAFMGGERRLVAGELGIHRPFFLSTRDAPDRQVRFRYMQKVLRDYIEELDFPASLYEAVMLVPPESIRVLGPEDLKRFYLEGISPSSEDIADAAAARRLNISMSEYLRRKAKAPACSSFAPGVGHCETNARPDTAGSGAAPAPRDVQTGPAGATGEAAERGKAIRSKP